MSEKITEVAVRISDEITLPFIASSLHGERFISESLNRKLSGVFKAGFCAGFKPELAGGMKINITSSHEKNGLGSALVENSPLTLVTVRQQSDYQLTIPDGQLSIVVLETIYGNIKTKQVDKDSNVDAVTVKVVTEKQDNQIEICRLDVPEGTTELTIDMLDTSNRNESNANRDIASGLEDDPNKLIDLKLLLELIESGELGGGSGSFLLPETIYIDAETNKVNLSLDYPIKFVFVNSEYQISGDNYSINQPDKTLTVKDDHFEVGDSVTVYYEVVKSNPNAKATQFVMYPVNGGQPMQEGVREIHIPFNAPSITMLNISGSLSHEGMGFHYDAEAKIIKLDEALEGGERIMAFTDMKAVDAVMPDAIQGFTFKNGATLNSINDFIYDHDSKQWYFWGGAFPKVVPEQSTIENSGGEDEAAWVGVGDTSLRSELQKSDGATKIGFHSRETTPSGTVGSYLKSISNNVIYSIDYGLNPSVTADNTDKLRTLFNSLSDGAIVDFCGEAYRIYANVNGVQASSANPATTDALEYSKVVALINKKNITLRNGTIYAANQATSSVKKYYPSTISFINCVGLHFDNFTAEGRGENYGAADAAIAQTKDRRLVHSATNGGHAAYFGRCHGITGNITTLLCGSTSPCYVSSCTGVAFDAVKSNSASYGYAAFNADNWVGLKEDLGVDYFDVLVGYLEAVAFPIYRREDGAQIGLSDVCGKGGGLAEGDGVVVQINSAKIRDMYDNTSNGVGVGYAFGAGAGAKLHSPSSHIRKCAYISRLSWGEDLHAECIVENTDAVVGLTGVQILKMSFGTGYAKLSGRVKVDKSLVKPDSNIAHYNISSLVANRKATSRVTVDLNVDIDPSSVIDCLIYNNTYACYGGVRFLGGTYYTDGYLIKSQGWGGELRNSGLGLQAVGGCEFIDRSTTAMDAYIQYVNKDTNSVFTYLYHDMSKAIFKSAKSRPLASYTIEQQTTLIEKLTLNTPQNLFYNSYSQSIDRRTCTLVVKEITGLSNGNTVIKAHVSDNSMLRVGAIGYRYSDIYGVSSDATPDHGDYSGAIFNITLDGDVRNKLQIGYSINFIIA